MNFDYSKLKGRIVEICGTRKEFAKRMGMTDRTLSLKLNNKIAFTQKNIINALDILSIDLSEIYDYFFKRIVQTSELRSKTRSIIWMGKESNARIRNF